MVIALLVGETYAYAWAFDRNALVGYPLPPSADIATAAAGAPAYIEAKDQAGIQRIAEQLMPAILGPVEERLSKLKRVIFVTDGPLQGGPITELARSEFPPGIEVITADYGTLSDTLVRTQSEPDGSARASELRLLAVSSILAILLIAGIIVMRRRRTSIS